MPTRQPGRLPLTHEWLLFLVGWLVFMPLIAICIPFAAVASWWDEHRLRRFYRNANRLLHWDEARQILHAGKGMLIIEVHLLERLGHVWWVESDLRVRHPAFPLVPARILDPSFDIEQRFKLLHDGAAKAWWETHLQELTEGVFLVQMPLTVWRRREKILAISSAVAVDGAWTYGFRNQRTR